MRVYFTNRNISGRFRNEQEIVEWMRKKDVQHTENITEFMHLYSDRKSLFNNLRINKESPVTFVQSLLEHNIIRIS